MTRYFIVQPFPEGGGNKGGIWGDATFCSGVKERDKVVRKLLRKRPAYSDINIEEVDEAGDTIG
jgi:hypothetical protein